MLRPNIGLGLSLVGASLKSDVQHAFGSTACLTFLGGAFCLKNGNILPAKVCRPEDMRLRDCRSQECGPQCPKRSAAGIVLGTI